MIERAKRRWLAALASTLVLAALVAAWRWGSRGPEMVAVGTARWPEATDRDGTEAVLRSACERAGERKRRLLVEFSAPWCEHCQRLKHETQAPVLGRALEGVDSVVVNIGEGNALDALRLELGARAIPYWTVVIPDRCDAPPSEWSRTASTFPTGAAPELARWLANAAGSRAD